MSNSTEQANSQSGAAQAQRAVAAYTGESVSAALSKKFDVVSKLTESDTRWVYLARGLDRAEGDRKGPEQVRLYVLPEALAGDQRQVELFRLEAAAAAMLSHESIMDSSEAQQIDGVHFCAVEEKPGLVTLRDYMRRKGWLDTDEAARVIRQVADALEYAHGRGVLHLALDPEKILLDPEGKAYVTGFGIGRAKGQMWARQERSHHCAALYISPEQILSAEVDQRSDLYLLGLILYEMLTDRTPFDSGDQSSLRDKHLTRTPAPPHMFRYELSKGLSQVVMDLLSKRPNGRPFTVAAFKTALDKSMAAGLVADEAGDADGAGEAACAAIIAGEEGEAMDYLDRPDSTYHDETADLSDEPPQVEEGRATVGEPQVVAGPRVVHYFDDYMDSDLDRTEAPPREAGEPEVSRPVAARPELFSQEPGRKRPFHLALLLALVVLAGGIFGAAIARLTQDEAPATAPELVAQSSSAAPSPSQAEAAAPATEPATPDPTKLDATAGQPPKSAAEATADERSAASKKDRDSAARAERAEDVPQRESPAPRSSEPAPPATSTAPQVSEPRGDSRVAAVSSAPVDARPREATPAPRPAVREAAPGPITVRKSGDVLQNTAIYHPKPARVADAKGTVTVEVTIDEDGSVVAARLVSGPVPLRVAALAAARRWKWTHTSVDRNRARVVGTITFNFRD
jgi:TonB family protein